jgi:hypothetical protein
VDEIGHRAHRVLYRHFRIDAVKVIEIDDVDAQTVQAGLAAGLHSLRACVDFGRRSSTRRRHEAELARQNDLAAAAADSPTHQRFIGALAVRICGIEQSDAKVERRCSVRIDSSSSPFP